MRSFGSRGQQRLLVLALRLAESPVLGRERRVAAADSPARSMRCSEPISIQTALLQAYRGGRQSFLTTAGAAAAEVSGAALGRSKGASTSSRCWPREPKLRMSRPSNSTARSSRWGPTGSARGGSFIVAPSRQRLEKLRLGDIGARADRYSNRTRWSAPAISGYSEAISVSKVATARRAPKDLDADLGQLLVPWRELLEVTTLKQVVTPSEDLPVPAMRREVRRLYLGREAVDEVAPRLRSPVRIARSCHPKGMARAHAHPSP